MHKYGKMSLYFLKIWPYLLYAVKCQHGNIVYVIYSKLQHKKALSFNYFCAVYVKRFIASFTSTLMFRAQLLLNKHLRQLPLLLWYTHMYNVNVLYIASFEFCWILKLCILFKLKEKFPNVLYTYKYTCYK